MWVNTNTVFITIMILDERIKRYNLCSLNENIHCLLYNQEFNYQELISKYNISDLNYLT